MSEMAMPTGATRLHRCKLCKTSTMQHEYRGIFFNTQTWTTGEHTAPCGQPCLGGRCYLSSIREAHGRFSHGRRTCPKGCVFPRVQRRVHARTYRLSSP